MLWSVIRSSCSDKTQSVRAGRGLETVLDQNAASIPVFQRIRVAAVRAKPEVLHGMSVGWFLTRWMILMETKQLTPLVVKRSPAIRVCANRKHESLNSHAEW